jgi:hypothetical protein
MRDARYLLAGLAWLFVGVIVLQVFFAGIGLFVDNDMSLHMGFGWLIPLFPLIVLIVCLPAGVDRSTGWLAAGTLVMTVVQISLPEFRDGLPYVAALHPVNALVVLGLGLALARRSTALAREPRPEEASAARSVKTSQP